MSKLKNYINYVKYRTQIIFNKLGWHVSKYKPLANEVNPAVVVSNVLGKTEGFVIIDGGAWIGNESVKYNDVFKSSQIFAFEPFPKSYAKLVENTSQYSNIFPQKLALSDENKMLEFHSNLNETTNSLMSSVLGTDRKDYLRKTADIIEVEATTLDSFCDEKNIDHIDFLKMDLQGGEMLALKGCVKLLEKEKISVIYSEIWFEEQYKNAPMYNHIASFLDDYGFVTYNMFGLNEGNDGHLMWGDVMYVHKNHIQKRLKH